MRKMLTAAVIAGLALTLEACPKAQNNEAANMALNEPAVDQVLVDESYSSALERYPELSPPATSTLPVLSSVAVWV